MKVAIYARVSTKDRQTNENQLLELRNWVAAMGHTIYKEYLDEMSGGRADREAFTLMFQEAHERKFDLVIFWALDRFSREGARQTINYLQQLETYGVQFKSFKEQYLDSTGIFKDVIVSLLATLAKQERLRMSERVIAGLDRVKMSGKKLGRPEFAKAAEIRTLASQGLSDRQIGKKLRISHRTVAKYKKEEPAE